MQNRRLSDAILAAHKIACGENKKQIASLLFEALELELTLIGGDHPDRRDVVDMIEAAFDLHEKTFGPVNPNDAFS